MQILAIVDVIIAIIMAFRSNSATKIIIIATMASKMIIKTIAGITATAWATSTDIVLAAGAAVLATIFKFVVL